jgi:glycosyltransferase involved in cell wall biosynthesis
MSKKRNNIAIVSVTNDLIADHRVHKTCLLLGEMNYDVTLVGRKLNTSFHVNRNYKTKRFKLFFNKKFLFYAEYNIRLFVFLLFKKADLLVSNDLDTLPANFIASKIKRVPLIYDSHEYFTEVPELIKRQRIKKIWQYIEKKIVTRLNFGITVNESIAEIYTNKYNIPFYAIKNVPSINNLTNNFDKTVSLPFSDELKYILLYQGSLNIGRGLEKLIKAMKLLNNRYVLFIIGIGDIENELKKKVKTHNLSDRIIFFGKIPFENLKQITAKAHLGFSIEENLGLNYYYALPNKIFDYIHAEVPIICSDFPEMKKIIETYNIGISVSVKDEYHLAELINNALSNKEQYLFWKENCKIAKKELNWEIEKEKLKKIIEKHIILKNK